MSCLTVTSPHPTGERGQAQKSKAKPPVTWLSFETVTA
jgi:hypothetical protein